MTASRSAWLIGVPTVVVVAAVAALILRFGAAPQSGDTIGGPDAEPPMEVTTPATRPVPSVNSPQSPVRDAYTAAAQRITDARDAYKGVLRTNEALLNQYGQEVADWTRARQRAAQAAQMKWSVPKDADAVVQEWQEVKRLLEQAVVAASKKKRSVEREAAARRAAQERQAQADASLAEAERIASAARVDPSRAPGGDVTQMQIDAAKNALNKVEEGLSHRPPDTGALSTLQTQLRRWADAKPRLLAEFTNSVGMTMVLIAKNGPVTFQMGSKLSAAEVARRFDDDAEYFEDEHPQHAVTISQPFYLAAHEVTVGQFRQFVQARNYKTDAEKGGQRGHNGKPGGFTIQANSAWGWREDANWRNPGFPQGDNHPVVLVSWNDARAFATWLNSPGATRAADASLEAAEATLRRIEDLYGRGAAALIELERARSSREAAFAQVRVTYRLPTEAEWEYACRGGTQTVFWWGDDLDTSGKVVNIADQAHRERTWGWKVMPGDDGYGTTAPIGSYRSNGFGLHDMIGNVTEWCEDWYDRYPGSDVQSDWFGKKRRVLRGGGWRSRPADCRSANRHRDPPDSRFTSRGFRVAAGTP